MYIIIAIIKGKRPQLKQLAEEIDRLAEQLNIEVEYKDVVA